MIATLILYLNLYLLSLLELYALLLVGQEVLITCTGYLGETGESLVAIFELNPRCSSERYVGYCGGEVPLVLLASSTTYGIVGCGSLETGKMASPNRMNEAASTLLFKVYTPSSSTSLAAPTASCCAGKSTALV